MAKHRVKEMSDQLRELTWQVGELQAALLTLVKQLEPEERKVLVVGETEDAAEDWWYEHESKLGPSVSTCVNKHVSLDRLRGREYHTTVLLTGALPPSVTREVNLVTRLGDEPRVVRWFAGEEL